MGWTGIETARVNWEESMGTTRRNLTAPFPFMFSRNTPSFHGSAENHQAQVCGGGQGQGRHTLCPPPAAGQPEPIGLSISIYAVGEAGPWAAKENQGEAPERAGNSLSTPCGEGGGSNPCKTSPGGPRGQPRPLLSPPPWREASC